MLPVMLALVWRLWPSTVSKVCLAGLAQAHRVGKTGLLTPDISKPREQVTRPLQPLSTFLLRSSLRSFMRSSLLTPTLVRRQYIQSRVYTDFYFFG